MLRSSQLLASLENYDKDNIPPKAMEEIKPHIEREELGFNPEVIKSSSIACSIMCTWCRAMYTYHQIRLEAQQPKKQRVEEYDGTEETGLVNLYKLEKPVFPCIKSDPNHDLRTGGNRSTVTFASRALELYFERPAKFKALATDFCRIGCKKLGDKGVGVDEDAVIIA